MNRSATQPTGEKRRTLANDFTRPRVGANVKCHKGELMNSNNLVAAILVIIALAGCASMPPPKDGVLGTNKQLAAVVYGQGGGIGEFLTALVPIGTHKDIKLVGIDGGGAQTAPDAKGREYWIVPEKHTLDISCSVQFDSRDTYGKSTVEITLEQGKEYLLDAKAKVEYNTWGMVRSCEPFIVMK